MKIDSNEIDTNNERNCNNYFSIKNLLKSQGGEEFKISFGYTRFDSCINDNYLTDVTAVIAVIRVGTCVEETIDSKAGIKYTVYKNSLISISTGNEDNDTILFGNLAIRDTTSDISNDNVSAITSKIVLTDDPDYCSVEDFVKLFETFYEDRYTYGFDFKTFLFQETDIKKKNSSFICIGLYIEKMYYGDNYCDCVYVRTEMSQINRYCNIDEVTHYNLDDGDSSYIYSLL